MKIAIQFNNNVGCVGLPYRFHLCLRERNIRKAVFDCGFLVTCRFEVKTTREKGNVAKYFGQDCGFSLSVNFAFAVQPTLVSENSPKVSYKH